ncbi:hypothetical protein MRB53_028601 [Persea americana]|uniref:Uncharacterized protein n=1 Tax=Persea americana TaxID=3435 RepID=A0ACC2KGG8_PERAE|nr:hypothetical protein MRB53_028601 [Persea americana]
MYRLQIHPQLRGCCCFLLSWSMPRMAPTEPQLISLSYEKLGFSVAPSPTVLTALLCEDFGLVSPRPKTCHASMSLSRVTRTCWR